MNLKPLPCDVGFADAELDHYLKEQSQLKVIIRAWNQKKIELVFQDVIQLLDQGIGDIANVCRETNQTDFLISALETTYESIPATHPYQEYAFLDHNDSKVLTVVAKSVDVRVAD
ncbi:hypothetical protein [Gimesia sp.]|uniref:hypothetical protein n=1 Tax=Gimesia sp. TaxID=2024833 RepID=UPI003A8CC7AE